MAHKKSFSMASFLLTAGLLLTCMSSSHAQEMSEHKELVHVLFGEADVSAVDCPPEISAALGEGTGADRYCGESHVSFAEFKNQWDIGVKRIQLPDAQIEALTEWESADGSSTRSYGVGGDRFDVLFSAGKVGVVWVSGEQPGSAEQEDKVYIAGLAGVTNPTLVSQVQPVYPELAKTAGIEANVNLRVTVLTTGKVADITVLQCTAPDLEFEQAAINAVEQWTYKPGTKNDIPVDTYFNVAIQFQIN